MPLVKPPDVIIPPPSGKPGGLGQRLEDALVRFASRVLNAAKDTLAGVLRFGLDTFLEGIEPFLMRAYGPMLAKIRDTPGCPPELKSLIGLGLSGESQAGSAVIGMLGSTVTSGMVGSFIGAALSPVTFYANSIFRPQRPDLPTLQALLRRGVISPTDYTTWKGDLGWGDTLATAIESITRPRPDVGTLAADGFRRNIPPEALRDELKRRGYLDPDINSILNVLKPLPGPGDLISMAVREAWDDGVASRYGYDQDYPAEFGEAMAKQGFDPEWSRRWWRAHWEVPGPTIAREMLHRTDMTEADYATLLKVADYPATWRRWMTEVAYAPYTRVDIRRMYQVGVLTTYAELVKAYNDIGYADDKAAKLADFTVLEYGESEREATRAEVMAAYQIGRLSPGETRSFLEDMGYPGWVIEMYVARVDMARTVSLAKETISHVKTMYVASQISKTDVYTTLGRIPLASTEIERYLEEWEIARTAKVARPSRADLRKFFLENEMDESELRQELRGYRLSERYIDWYVADAKRELVRLAQDESEKAVAEALKVRTRAEKTTYDIAVADIAVEIAQLNLTMADLKASATPEMTLEEITEISELVVLCQLWIKALQLQKAQTWSEYLREKEV